MPMLPPEKEAFNIQEEQGCAPYFRGATKLGNTVYIAGKGAHFEGDIKAPYGPCAQGTGKGIGQKREVPWKKSLK